MNILKNSELDRTSKTFNAALVATLERALSDGVSA